MKDVFLDWHLGDRFGWGILGLALFHHWARHAEVRPLMGHPITPASWGASDPLRLTLARPAIERSNRHLAGLGAGADGRVRVDAIVVDAMGNDFRASHYDSRTKVARCIFETTDLVQARSAVERHDALLVASTWGAQLLEAATGRRPKVIHEGIDPSLFCPGPRSGLLDPDAFHVFSGGKVEFRKGQDLVLLAFERFAARHDDAVLVTAWQSIWPQLAMGFRGRLAVPVEATREGLLDIRGWAHRNGIDASRVIDLGLVPNATLPMVLRDMDVALQPSRAEACTSLPVKEAMACEVPVIAPANTGLLDLVDDDRAIVLTRQSSISGPDASATEGWGESDLDEIVEALEFAYARRDEARRRGRRARAWLIEQGRTWRTHADELARWLVSLA